MKEKTKRTIQLVCGSVLGAYTVVCGALLIWQIVSVYKTGTAAGYEGDIFSREIVGRSLARIAPALWIWIALAVVCFALSVAFSVAERILKPDVRYSLCRMKKRMPKSVPESMQLSYRVVLVDDLIIKILWGICAAIALSGAVYAIVYLADPSHFPQSDPTAEVVAMVKKFIPWVTWAFLFAVAIAICEGQFAKRQMEALKQINKGVRPEDRVGDNSLPHRIYLKIYGKSKSGGFWAFVLKVTDFFRTHGLTVVRGAVACFAVAFIIAGAFNGTAHDVLAKAINICTECIGLG